MEHSRIIHHYWTSPCGILDLASIGEQLVMCDWVDGWHRAATLNPTDQASYGRRCLIGY